MFCESCGSFIPDNQSFCSNCGAPAPNPVQPEAQAPETPAAQPVFQQAAPQPVQPAYQQPAPQPVQPAYQQPVYAQPVNVAPTTMTSAPEKRGNAPAVVGLVFGILTLILFWVPVFNIFTTCIFGLIGLIFSIIGIAKKNAKGKALGVVGLVLTILGTIMTVLFYVFIFQTIASDPELSREFEDVMAEFEDISSPDYTYEESDGFYIEGDFATTDKGYVSGVLHVDDYVVEF